MKWYLLEAEPHDTWDQCFCIELPWWLDPESMEHYKTLDRDWPSFLYAFSVSIPVPSDFPVVANMHNVHVVSGRLKEALTRLAPGCCRFLPIGVRTTIGDVIPEEFFVIRYDRLNVVDRKRSVLLPHATFRKLEGEYLLELTVLDLSKASQPVFRVDGCCDRFVYREDIVDELRCLGFSGLNFREVPPEGIKQRK